MVLGGTAIRPKERKGFDKIANFLHDKEEGTWCSRSLKSWGQITTFYIIYYTCLAAFWYGMMNIFFLTLPIDGPKYQHVESVIGKNPGIGVRPKQNEEKIASSLYMLNLDYDGVNEGDVEAEGNIGYATRLKRFFEVYEDNKSNSNATLCSGDKPGQAEEGKFCKFDTSILGPCEAFPYGYGAVNGEIKPCMYVKLNRIFGLTPEPIKEEADFPEDTSDKVKDMIRSAGFPDKIFIDCEGEYPADREVLEGNFEHFPSDQTVSLKYFPMQTKNANENAIVAVQFRNLPRGRLVHVSCKTYFKGAVHDKKTKAGMVNFQLMVKDEEKKEL